LEFNRVAFSSVILRPVVDPNEALDIEGLRMLLSDDDIADAHLHVLPLDPARQGEIWGRDPTAALNAFVLQVRSGHAVKPVARWDLLERDYAHTVLRDALRWEQAYGSERLELAVADRIATGFVELFDASGRFFTNWRFESTARGLRATSGSGSVTGATFEAGVVAVDGQRMGLLYVADED